MIFSETKLNEVILIELEKLEDKRGFFARTWDQKQFKKKGLNHKIFQCSISFNKKRGTVRGLHYQIAPYEEAKVVSCTRGKIFDVIVDLRPKSRTFKDWLGVQLSAKNYRMIYIPEGFAHGFQTLEDNTVIYYQISQPYSPQHARGIRWDDKTFQIKWPLKTTIISKKDLSYEPFNEQAYNP